MELHALQAMVKVTVGKAEDPWCEIDLTEEDVEDPDHFKGFGFGIFCLQDLVAQRSGCASWMHEGSFRRGLLRPSQFCCHGSSKKDAQRNGQDWKKGVDIAEEKLKEAGSFPRPAAAIGTSTSAGFGIMA